MTHSERTARIAMCRKELKIPHILPYAVCFMLIVVWTGLVFAQTDLKTTIPELCYKCHEKLKEDLSGKHVHFVFKDGKCNVCHNPHVSNINGLMRGEINSICLNCHKAIKEIYKKSNLHSPLKRGACTDCHNAHSSENKYLLVKEEKELCLSCHENLKEQLKQNYLCQPFKEGKCSACHNSHASSEDDLLVSAPKEACKKCHAPRCKVGTVSIASITAEMDCTSCHTGHGSQAKGLLGPNGHTAFLNKTCEQCHNPIAANKKITTLIEGKNLCFSCHKRDVPTKYIDDDIHVKDAGNPCVMCHDVHASGRKNMTKKESRICSDCHEATEKRITFMEKSLKSVKCSPISDRKCFQCHMRKCSNQRPFFFSDDTITICSMCHKKQHDVTHPVGSGVIDPRNGQTVTCVSCHSMHSARADFLLTFDRKRALCIQCHNR
jgi:predicted CXXCH cytochrome family protein